MSQCNGWPVYFADKINMWYTKIKEEIIKNINVKIKPLHNYERMQKYAQVPSPLFRVRSS
jgi:hypothetical protein